MFQFIDRTLDGFRKCFSRKAAYDWFIVVVIGLMVRSDHLGVTSFIRELGLRSGVYESLLHFFRASSWKLGQVRETWYKTVKANAPVCREGKWTILIGDGVKQAKEARHMPGVKKLFQESEDSSKPDYIFGHMFGGLGVLIGGPEKRFCLPLSIRLHDGLQFLEAWKGKSGSITTHVVQMVEDAYNATRIFGDAIVLLDRLFLSVPALARLAELNASHAARLEIVTKAKQNCVAYTLPDRKGGRGRPPKKGRKIVLRELFERESALFHNCTMELYGKQTEVAYRQIDLLWGQGLYQMLRFVLVKYNGTRSILVSTSLELPPETIIRLYGRRFKIESCFRELKQQIGAFGYHFWTRAMPKLSHFQKKGSPDPLAAIQDARVRASIAAAVQAVERFVMLACVAMGLVQIVSLRYSDASGLQNVRYLRTLSSTFASEGTTMCSLRQNIFRFIALCPDSGISRIIREKSVISRAQFAA